MDATTEWLIQEIKNLRDEKSSLLAAIATEHHRTNGASVYVNEPQHDRSLMKCTIPMCVLLRKLKSSSS